MACCMFGLLLVYQLIEAWQRARRLGLRSRAALRAGLTRLGGFRRVAWVALIFFQLGVGAAHLDAHAAQLGSLAGGASAGVGQWCRGALAAAGLSAAPGS
ncbi:MAG: hypothetical protein FJ164_13900 [Gammaproteobacteria bacterium]|nr:hypothetical protein [Gammaproteobacteria bacterium]